MTSDIDLEKISATSPSSLATPSETPTAEAPQEAADKPAVPAIGPPPDGGTKAWLTLVGAFLISFVQFGLANSYGVFQGYYETHQLADRTPDDISWIGSLQQFLLFFGGLFSGRMFDAYGPHALLIPGSVIFIVSLMLISLCKEYYQFMLAQGVLFGLGSALIFQPTISTPSQWFAKKRAMATAIVVCGSGIGGTLWPIALQRMFNQIGFGWTLRATGFIALGTMGLGNALIRGRIPRRKPAPFRGTFKPFKEMPYTFLCAGAAISIWGMFMPFFYITTNASRLGASPSLAFYTLSFLNAGSTVGRLAAGLGDRVGRFNLMTANILTLGILLLAFWIPLNSVAALIVFGVIYGLFAGVVISLLPACVAQISQLHEIGARVGLVYAVVALFVLSGPPINGALLHYGGRTGYQYVGVFSGLACLVGGGLCGLARWRLDGGGRAAV